MVERLDDFAEVGGSDLGRTLESRLRSGQSPAIRRQVAIYLLSSPYISACMGIETDVFDGEPLNLTCSMQSDGEWYWRCDLAHYVLKYGVGLPKAFMAKFQEGQHGPLAVYLDEERLGAIGAEALAKSGWSQPGVD